MIGNRLLVAWGWGRDGTEDSITKTCKETLGGDPYAHYLDCGDGFRGVFIC